VVFAAGVFVIAFTACHYLFGKIGKTDWLAEIKKIQNIRDTGLSDSMQKWIMRAEKEVGKAGILNRFSNRKTFLIAVLPLSAAGLWFGLAYFHNLVAAVLLALIGVLLPEQIAYAQERTYQEKVMEQLGTAVRMFAAEYTETPNTIRALGLAAARLPDPIGTIFRQTGKDFTSGKDINGVLIGLSRKLDFEYGRLFVQLLRLSFEDSAVGPMFMRLASRLASQQKLIRKNRVEVALDRSLSILLNLAVIPVYIFISRTVPDAPGYFVATASGRTIIAICLVSIIVGIVLDRMLGQGGEMA
jgi:pilus assembly protein CpaF